MRYLDRANHVLHLVSSYTVRVLREAGARVKEPAGGFYTFPDFTHCEGIMGPARQKYQRETRGSPEDMTSAWLMEDILKQTGVAMLPGTAFGRLPEEPSARLAFVDFDGNRAMRAVTKKGTEGPESRVPDEGEDDLLGKYSSTPSQYLDAPDHPVGQEQEDFLKELAPSVYEGMQKLAHYLRTGEGLGQGQGQEGVSADE